MRPLLAELAERLAELRRRDLARGLHLPAGIDFSSNDYLGLARHPGFAARLRERIATLGDEELAAPASRLLCGHTAAHAHLEERLARFKGTEAALFFSSGYLANVGLLTALLQPQDRALSDAANHASLIDGLRLAGCTKVILPHLDLEALEGALATPHPGGRTFVVTESLFSMDGDIAPLDRYAELAARYGAELIVDDAHATGVFGEDRRSGLTEVFGVEGRAAAILSTCGKALAAGGAFVAAPRVVIETLINRARPFVFTTAASPLLVAAVEAALDALAALPELGPRALASAGLLRRALALRGLAVAPGEGPIVPVVLGENALALAVAAELRQRGFDLRAVRPPTVPAGTARLRISVHADHAGEDLERLAAALADCRAALPVGAV